MGLNKLVGIEIEQFYSAAAEDKRLSYGLGPLEFERNKELISRYLPSGEAVIADIGGGPGSYAAWLAGLGHAVRLVDPVEKHIQQAQKRAAKLKKSFQAILGEARNLNFADGFADMVILHGPLYHLQLRHDRLKALKEAHRVLKSGGVMLGFAINHTASTLTGLLNGMIHDPQFFELCQSELQTGLHNPPTTCLPERQHWPGILPEAFFHKPQELMEEVLEAHFTAPEIFAVEGMIWLDRKYFETRSDPEKKEAMMGLLKSTEQNPELLSLSPHLMISGRKE